MIYKEKYVLKKLVNEYGFYCELELEVKKSDRKEIIVDLGFYKNSRWKNSFEFGIDFFYEKYERLNDGGLDIKLLNFKDNIVDTKNIVVVFAIIKCLSKMLTFNIDGLEINEEGIVCFPK
jgi:hypothetical protein